MGEDGKQAELSDLVRRIQDYQHEIRNDDGSRVSDAQMCARFPALGSPRQYQRIVSGDVESIDVAKNVANLQTVAACIELMKAGDEDNEPLYDDLSYVLDLRKAVADAMKEKGLNRYVHMQAPQGSGKTTAARLLQARYGARVVMAEATEIWKENMNAMLAGLLDAHGIKNPPIPVADKFVKLVERLSETRVCTVIDEAHHLGPKTINLVKSLINHTPGEFVLLAMGTLWARLETTAYSEALQLTKNRMLERIRSDGVEAADIEKMLARRLGMSGDVTSMAKGLVAQARGAGNMSFVKLVCRRARRLAGKGAVTLDVLAKAAALVAASR